MKLGQKFPDNQSDVIQVTSYMKVEDIVAYQLCCGCGACVQLHPNQIKMVDVLDLGKRPQIYEPADGDELFEDISDVCPGIEVSHSDEALAQRDIIPSLLEDWGPVLEIWEGHASDSEMRFKGSSGGAISALALYCVEMGEMAGVLQTTADPEKPYVNISVMSRTRDDILGATGSRYSPASPCEKLHLIEDAQAPCVFVGKPCDVFGASNVSRVRDRLKERMGVTIALFCAGTPSTEGTLEMLRQMGIEEVADLSELRYRGAGWPGNTTAKCRSVDGEVQSELTYQESWGGILQKYRQWRCYICPDHTGEFADIAVGDPWYRAPMDGEHGSSLILARTYRGKEIVEQAISSGYLVAERRDPKVLPDSQPNLLKARSALWGRIFTLRSLRAPYPKYRNIPLFSSWIHRATLKEKAQSVYGTMRRVYRKKLKAKYPLNS